MDPVELVAKHVQAIRFAEVGGRKNIRVTDEDREIARDIIKDLVLHGDGDHPDLAKSIAVRKDEVTP